MKNNARRKYKSKFQPWIRVIALLIGIIFSFQQITWARGFDLCSIRKSITSRIKQFKPSTASALFSPSRIYDAGKNMAASYINYKYPSAIGAFNAAKPVSAAISRNFSSKSINNGVNQEKYSNLPNIPKSELNHFDMAGGGASTVPMTETNTKPHWVGAKVQDGISWSYKHSKGIAGAGMVVTGTAIVWTGVGTAPGIGLIIAGTNLMAGDIQISDPTSSYANWKTTRFFCYDDPINPTDVETAFMGVPIPGAIGINQVGKRILKRQIVKQGSREVIEQGTKRRAITSTAGEVNTNILLRGANYVGTKGLGFGKYLLSKPKSWSNPLYRGVWGKGKWVAIEAIPRYGFYTTAYGLIAFRNFDENDIKISLNENNYPYYTLDNDPTGLKASILTRVFHLQSGYHSWRGQKDKADHKHELIEKLAPITMGSKTTTAAGNISYNAYSIGGRPLQYAALLATVPLNVLSMADGFATFPFSVFDTAPYYAAEGFNKGFLGNTNSGGKIVGGGWGFIQGGMAIPGWGMFSFLTSVAESGFNTGGEITGYKDGKVVPNNYIAGGIADGLEWASSKAGLSFKDFVSPDGEIVSPMSQAAQDREYLGSDYFLANIWLMGGFREAVGMKTSAKEEQTAAKKQAGRNQQSKVVSTVRRADSSAMNIYRLTTGFVMAPMHLLTGPVFGIVGLKSGYVTERLRGKDVSLKAKVWTEPATQVMQGLLGPTLIPSQIPELSQWALSLAKTRLTDKIENLPVKIESLPVIDETKDTDSALIKLIPEMERSFQQDNIKLSDWKDLPITTKERIPENHYEAYRSLKDMEIDMQGLVHEQAQKKKINECEVEGLKVARAISNLEAGIPRSSIEESLRPYLDFAQKNMFLKQIKGKTFKYDLEQLAFGWDAVKNYCQSRAKDFSYRKRVINLGAAKGKSSEIAVVLSYLSEIYPKDKLIFHTLDDKLVSEMESNLQKLGVKNFNTIAQENIAPRVSDKNKNSPFQNGINLVDTHTLNTLHKKGLLKGKFIFSDEPPAALEQPMLVIAIAGSLGFSNKKINLLHHSDMMLTGIIVNKLGKSLGMKLRLKDFHDGSVVEKLLTRDIIEEIYSGAGEYRIKDRQLVNKIVNEYRGSTSLPAEKIYPYKDKELSQAIQTITNILAKQEGQHFYIDRDVHDNFKGYHIGDPAPNKDTRFASAGERVLSNMASRALAVKYEANSKIYEGMLNEKTEKGSSYADVIDTSNGFYGFSATTKDFRSTFEKKGIEVVEIGTNYDKEVIQKTHIRAKEYIKGATNPETTPLLRFTGNNVIAEEVVKEISIRENKQLFENGNLDSFSSAKSAVEIKKAASILKNIQSQTTFTFDESKKQGQPDLVFNKENRLIDKQGKILSVSYTYKQGEVVLTGIENYRKSVKIVEEHRKDNPKTSHIVLMQDLLEGSNIAVRTGNPLKQANMILHGLYSKSRVLQAAQRIGITQPTEARRTPGKFIWKLEQWELPVEYREAYAKANEQGRKDIAFLLAQDMLIRVNAQRISDAQGKIDKISAIKLIDFQEELSREYATTRTSDLDIDSVLNSIFPDKEIRSFEYSWFKDKLSKYTLTNNKLTKEGEAIVGLINQIQQTPLASMVNNNIFSLPYAMDHDINSNFRQSFEIAQHLVQTQWIGKTYISLDKLVLMGTFLESIGSPEFTIEEANIIAQSYNPVEFFEFVKQKLGTANSKSKIINAQLLPIANHVQEVNNLEQKDQAPSRLKRHDSAANRKASLGNLDKIAASLGVDSLNLQFLLISNLNDITNEQLNTLAAINMQLNSVELKNTIDKNSLPFIDMIAVAKGKIGMAALISKNSGNPNLESGQQQIPQMPKHVTPTKIAIRKIVNSLPSLLRTSTTIFKPRFSALISN